MKGLICIVSVDDFLLNFLLSIFQGLMKENAQKTNSSVSEIQVKFEINCDDEEVKVKLELINNFDDDQVKVKLEEIDIGKEAAQVKIEEIELDEGPRN